MTTDQLALTKNCSPFGLLVLADYLEESGDTFHAREFRLGIFTDTAYFPSYDLGDGHGHGYGDGHGFRNGDGYGDGGGSGYGDGDGNGYRDDGNGFPY